MSRTPRLLQQARTGMLCMGFLLVFGMVGGPASIRSPGADNPFLIELWDIERDLPNSTVTAVKQTRDGYLWVGTYNGLARFDGIRFVVFDPVNTPELSNARIQELFLDDGGTLWIHAYDGGLTSYRDGTFELVRPGGDEYDTRAILLSAEEDNIAFGLHGGELIQRRRTLDGAFDWESVEPPAGRLVSFTCADREGAYWYLTRDGRPGRYLDGQYADLEGEIGLNGTWVQTLMADSRGRVWAGTDMELAVWNGTRFETMTPTNGEPAIWVSFLFTTRDGGVWVVADGRVRKAVGRRWVAEAKEWEGMLGTAAGRSMGAHEDREGGVWFNHYGNGLFHATHDGRYLRLTSSDGLPGNRVGAWFQDVEGNVWAGIDRGGLARLREKQFEVLDMDSGLLARAVSSVCEDEDGTLWIGTFGGGLSRLAEGRLESFGLGDVPARSFVFSVYPRRGGGVWLSTRGEDLYYWDEGGLHPAPWEAHGVKCILEDSRGQVWLGMKNGLSRLTEEGAAYVGREQGMPVTVVRTVAEAPDGAIWCGGGEGSLFRWKDDRLQVFRADDRLADQPIWSLCIEPNGVIWAGTFRGGLLRFREGRFTRITKEHGLSGDVISQILDDGQGHLWLGTHHGMFRASKAALNAHADGASATVDGVAYGLLDGLPSLEFSGGYQPSSWRTREGRLWFSTVKGLVSVKPESLRPNPLPPSVVIEEMRVGNEVYEAAGRKVVIPPGQKQFEFRFTALSFAAPDKVRFRYRLASVDDDWVEAGARRTAQYSHLEPGSYDFQVIACNNDGVWNLTGSHLAFVLRPHFHETGWFLGLTVLVMVAALAGTVRHLATRRLRRRLALVEQQHAIEQDRARIARDIHDDMGAGLTQITLLSEFARQEPPDQARGRLERISEAARELTRAMDEIVWAVDPQHDTVEGFIGYACTYAEDYLRLAGIRCRMDLPTPLPALHLDTESRHNLFLALKETVNNIIKHSGATEVWIRMSFSDEELALIIEDNGHGINGSSGTVRSGRISSGHGLDNLAERMASSGGRCEVINLPEKGLRVVLAVRRGKYAQNGSRAGR